MKNAGNMRSASTDEIAPWRCCECETINTGEKCAVCGMLRVNIIPEKAADSPKKSLDWLALVIIFLLLTVLALAYFFEPQITETLLYNKTVTLMEKGQFVQAITASSDLKDSRYDLNAVFDYYAAKIYVAAIKEYRDKQYSNAYLLFNSIPKYGRSDDYMLLLDIHQYKDAGKLSWGWDQYNKNSSIREKAKLLLELLQFEDANELLMSATNPAILYLTGVWGSWPANLNVIQYESDGKTAFSASWYVPDIPSGTWRFEDSYWYITAENEPEEKVAQFTILDSDSFELTVLKTGEKYIMKRQ